MIELNGEQIADFLHRSYTAVDGLWCMKVEEKYGFDVALDIDNEVWKVLPKIQARKMKELTGLSNGIDAFFECLTTKMTIERYTFKAEKINENGSFRITTDDCAWHNTMVRSGRGHLSASVGRKICDTEFSVWASEFGDDIKVSHTCRICEGSPVCVLEATLK